MHKYIYIVSFLLIGLSMKSSLLNIKTILKSVSHCNNEVVLFLSDVVCCKSY